MKEERQEPVSLLVSLDEGYVPQLRVMLTSVYLNDPFRDHELHLLHRSLSAVSLASIAECCARYGFRFYPHAVADELFQDAPVTDRYPREMYYRLMAGELLPPQLEKVLYLDPDILVINPLTPLWDLELGEHLFAAAAHTGKTELSNSVNRIRLKVDHDYFNSGVLLMNLKACRQCIRPQELFAFVRAHEKELLFPDQDVLNMCYGDHVQQVEDALWNYDARNYSSYMMRSGGRQDLQWVMTHTAILHFCGRAKPWHPGYRYRFGMLYRHYMQLSERLSARQS